MESIFHLAYNVTCLDKARAFYTGILGCKEARSSASWVDFDFFGHQISLHLGQPFRTKMTGLVSDCKVPMPHLGVILPISKWRELADDLESKGIEFLIAPHVRYAGAAGEQSTMFFEDPFGNPIEIKGFGNQSIIFET